MADQIRLRRDNESDWAATPTAALKSGELGLVHDDTTGAFLGRLRIGTMVPGNVEASTLFSSLVDWHLLDQADRDKLTGLVPMTGSAVVSLINAELGTDLATAINATSLTYNGLATILDTGPNGVLWREPPALSWNGTQHVDGELMPAPGDYGIADITDLVSALAAKSDIAHGHATTQITGLDAALNSKISSSLIGAPGGVAPLDEATGKILLTYLPTDLGAAVTSIFTRSGAVVAAAGDYNAGQITATPAGTLVGTDVAAQITELRTEKLETSLLGAAGGIPQLDGSSKLLLTNFPVPALSVITTALYWQFAGSTTFTPPAGATPTDPFSQARHHPVNLTNAKETYIVSLITTAAAAATGCKLVGEYSTDGGSTWILLGSELLIDGTAGTGTQQGTAVAVPVGAKTSVRIRTGIVNGNGSASTTLANTNLHVVYETPINNGALTGAQQVTALNAELGSTVWQGSSLSLADNSVALAKLVNFATQTAPLRFSAGTGPLEVGTQANWRTFLGVPTSVHGRTGAVVAASGDYTADQITQTATRVFISPSALADVNRLVTRTEFTSSSVIGLNEHWAVFTGGTTTALTGTLTNNSTVFFISVINFRTVSVTVAVGAGQTMATASGASITNYSLAAGSSICAARVGTVWRILV